MLIVEATSDLDCSVKSTAEGQPLCDSHIHASMTAHTVWLNLSVPTLNILIADEYIMT